jgi:FkbM family methyltransferase
LKTRRSLSTKTRLFDWFRSVFKIELLERVLLPVVRGAPYGSVRTKLIPNPHQYSPKTFREVERDGINWELDISCMTQWPMFWGLTEVTRDRLYSLVHRGDTVFDVGANIGETTLHFAGLVGPAGRVYAFEPDPYTHERARINISLNAFSNIKLFQAGIAEEEKEARLVRVDEHNLGMNRILPEESISGCDSARIRCRTLDGIVRDETVSGVSLIKMDIEGYEMNALRGARDTLERFHPALFIEVGDSKLRENGSSASELIRFLLDIGYRVFLAPNEEEIDDTFVFPTVEGLCIDVFARI